MRKMSKQFIVVAVLIFIAGGFLYLQEDRRTEDLPLSQQFEEKTTSIDGITIVVQPELFDDDNLTFSIQLTTHSGDLSMYSPGSNIRLKSGDEELVPLRAENVSGSGPSEHHRELIVVFPGSPSSSFALVLLQLAGATETTLQWP
ncbi:MAG: hypothetical protein A3A80_03380 [Candidatus Terrybacteria bacterium RIFCSPLOWO2_01_FULL_44_24]|nr:MAG: hypothetical protein A3B75_01870 [Candidatus Terrybacteria bacterium RIFCSPHIGHO2_02_FULL_43_14]OHA51551.1 MAG: hypothetical protein A3A80_03380 [Candidatus Terrybacteria bacterium RIFCSPLOWO2_01_FULL_44_24]